MVFNYYSFSGFKFKRFFIDAVNMIYPLTMTRKTIKTNKMMVITRTTIMTNIMTVINADKDSKPDIPVDTCYPVYALRMPRINRA